MKVNLYTEKEALEDANYIIDNIMRRTRAGALLREKLAERLVQIVAREIKRT